MLPPFDSFDIVYGFISGFINPENLNNIIKTLEALDHIVKNGYTGEIRLLISREANADEQRKKITISWDKTSGIIEYQSTQIRIIKEILELAHIQERFSNVFAKFPQGQEFISYLLLPNPENKNILVCAGLITKKMHSYFNWKNILHLNIPLEMQLKSCIYFWEKGGLYGATPNLQVFQSRQLQPLTILPRTASNDPVVINSDLSNYNKALMANPLFYNKSYIGMLFMLVNFFDFKIYLYDVSRYHQTYLNNLLRILSENSDEELKNLAAKAKINIIFMPEKSSITQDIDSQSIVIFEDINTGDDCLIAGAAGIQLSDENFEETLPGQYTLLSSKTSIEYIRKFATGNSALLEENKKFKFPQKYTFLRWITEIIDASNNYVTNIGIGQISMPAPASAARLSR